MFSQELLWTLSCASSSRHNSGGVLFDVITCFLEKFSVPTCCTINNMPPVFEVAAAFTKPFLKLVGSLESAPRVHCSLSKRFGVLEMASKRFQRNITACRAGFGSNLQICDNNSETGPRLRHQFLAGWHNVGIFWILPADRGGLYPVLTPW